MVHGFEDAAERGDYLDDAQCDVLRGSVAAAR
jgi:hypothetical protein